MLLDESAVAIAARVRAGDASCREVVRAHLDRIAADRHGAVTVALEEPALAQADALDRARARGDALGPLAGVPFTVKESIDCAGSATTIGVPARRDALPWVDAPAVARLRAAGAVLVGRTNTSELAMRIAGGNPLRGLTLNPWDHRRTTGGSSAGDAVAVARGLVPFGLGSDMGGSLRVPAAFAGVAAIKPTTGRVPWASSLPPEDLGLSAQLMLAAGPLARSVADLRAVLAVIAGRDPRDPCSVDAPPSPPLDEPRVALVTEPDGEPLPLATRRAIERAGEAAARAGWSVVIAEPPELARVGEVWHRLAAQDIAAMLPHVEPILSDALRDYLARFVRAARLEEVTTLRLHQERARLGRAWAGFFAEHPVTIGPAVVGPPWLVDADLDPARGVAMLEAATRFVLPANALGHPALALPMGVDELGLPVAVQISADRFREDLCLSLAEAIEGAAGRGATR